MARDFLDEGEEARTDPRPTRPAPVRKAEPEERKLPVDAEERLDPMTEASRRLRAAIDGRKSAVFQLSRAKKALAEANQELLDAKAAFDTAAAQLAEEAGAPMDTGETADDISETF